MRKLFCLCICCVLLAITGCNKPIKQPPVDTTESTTPATTNAEDQPIVQTVLQLDPYSGMQLYSNGVLLYDTQRGDSATMVSDLHTYAYHVNSQQTVELEQFEWYAGDHRLVRMGNGCIYYYPMFADYPNDVNRLLELNPVTGMVTTLKEEELGYPLVPIVKLNESEFLYNVGTYVGEGDNVRRLSYYIYNVDTHETTFWKSFQFDRNTMLGTSSTLAQKDGEQLYVLVEEYNGYIDTNQERTNHQQRIEVYDMDGTLQKALDLPERINNLYDSFGNEESIWDYMKFGDYQYFGTVDCGSFIYCMEDDQLVEVPVPTACRLICEQWHSTWSEDMQYVFFGEMDTDDFLSSILILDTQTGQFFRYKLTIDGHVTGFITDEKNNLAIAYYGVDYNPDGGNSNPTQVLFLDHQAVLNEMTPVSDTSAV